MCWGGGALQDLTFDFHNNGIYLTKRPASAKTPKSASKTGVGNAEDGALGVEADGGEVGGESATTVFINPHDRNGKVLSKRFTTRRVRPLFSICVAFHHLTYALFQRASLLPI